MSLGPDADTAPTWRRAGHTRPCTTGRRSARPPTSVTIEKRAARNTWLLATLQGKSCASLQETRRHEILASFENLPRAGQGDLWNFAGRCRKFRTASGARVARAPPGCPFLANGQTLFAPPRAPAWPLQKAGPPAMPRIRYPQYRTRRCRKRCSQSRESTRPLRRCRT